MLAAVPACKPYLIEEPFLADCAYLRLSLVFSHDPVTDDWLDTVDAKNSGHKQGKARRQTTDDPQEAPREHRPQVCPQVNVDVFELNLEEPVGGGWYHAKKLHVPPNWPRQSPELHSNYRALLEKMQ
jgi:hypothetical protein